MQQILQSLEKFIASPLCIFDFKTIDYPTQFQQHLITNYFEMNNLLKTYAHNDVIRQLHTSERNMQSFIAGLLYQMLLEPTSSHFQTYMPSLRTESWMQFSKLMQQLLTDSFLWLKEEFRWGIIALLEKLCYYRHLEADHLVLAVKTMDYLDLSQSSMNFNNQMLQLFYQILTESAQTAITRILAKTLFFKLLRMMSVLVCLEDESVWEYKSRCVAVMQKLFQVQRERCLVVGNSGINIIKELQSEQLLHSFLPQLKQALQKAQVRPESSKSASLRLSCILPMRVQSTLLFVIHQNLTNIEVKLQLDWVFNSSSEQNILLVIDILRYILALSVEEMPIKECIFVLEWLFYRVCANNVLLQVWKDELFFPCFAEPCPFPAAPERAFHFLAYLLENDVDFGQSLLVFLLRHVQVSKKAELLKSMLTRANELKILNLSTLINHPRLRARTKEELLVVLGLKKTSNHTQETPQNLQTVYYDPFSFVRKDSEISLDFSEESHESQQYANSSEEVENMEGEEQKQKKGRVKLEKIFVEDMGESLTELLEKPNLPIYTEFYKELLRITKQFRVNEEHSMIETFVSETAKITYLLFQNQFQSHSQLVAKEHNIIFHLLNSVALEWRTNSFNLQLTKKIIKRICEYFPTAELAIWRIFLIHFRRGVVFVGREMRQWLIAKDKAQWALSLLRELGSLSKQMIENAQYLKLPY